MTKPYSKPGYRRVADCLQHVRRHWLVTSAQRGPVQHALAAVLLQGPPYAGELLVPLDRILLFDRLGHDVVVQRIPFGLEHREHRTAAVQPSIAQIQRRVGEQFGTAARITDRIGRLAQIASVLVRPGSTGLSTIMMALASMRTNVDSTSLLAVTPLLFGSNPSGVRRDSTPSPRNPSERRSRSARRTSA